jgi:hypothetical protein
VSTKQQEHQAKKVRRELAAKLQVIRRMTTTPQWSYKYMEELRSAVTAGKIHVVEHRSNSHLYDYKFEDQKSTSTFDECRDFEIYWHPTDPWIVLRIWDGDTCNGQKVDVRVTYRLEGDWTAVPLLVDAVNHAFERNCLYLYDQEQEQARKDAARRLGQMLISAVIEKDL